MTLTKTEVVVMLPLLIAALAIAFMFPELRRYLRISRM
jgi:hypothetical protein